MRTKLLPQDLNVPIWAGLFLAIVCILRPSSAAQTSSAAAGGAALGSGLGAGAFDATAYVLFSRLKESSSTASMGPKRLDFGAVSIRSKPAQNLVEITNGTKSQIELLSLSLPNNGFHISSSLVFPVRVPPQTRALLRIEFLPPRPGEFNGEARMLYRTSANSRPHRMEIAMKAKGVQEERK